MNKFFYFSTKKQVFLAKRLSFLIKSGASIVESVQIIKNQAKSKREIEFLEKIVIDVNNGLSLASSMQKLGRIFGNFAINVIRAGEESGTLIQNLEYLSLELKKKEILRKKILSAMLYPLIITLATVGITGVLVIHIFPKITPIFKSLHTDLPWSTKAVIFLSNLARNHFLILFLAFILTTALFIILMRRSEKFRFFLDGVILRFPYFGSLAKNFNLTNITRTLGLLLQSGMRFNEALLITAETTGNLRYKKSLHEISKEVAEGRRFSEAALAFPVVFPDILVHMVSVGERSGNLSSTLEYLSEFYEHEFDDLTKNFSASIEPVLMVSMGLVVGFVAISVITPIYELTNSIKR